MPHVKFKTRPWKNTTIGYLNMNIHLDQESSTAPFSLFHANGMMRKTNKSILIAALENLGEIKSQLPSAGRRMTAINIVDHMALVQTGQNWHCGDFWGSCIEALSYYNRAIGTWRM